jgi:mannose-1-phosphate guanylyltransferase
VRGGRHLWNAGVFVWRAATLLEEVEACCPELHRAMAPLRRTPSAARSREALERTYRRAPSLPIDVAVMERSRRVWTLPVEFRWSDVGTWASLAEELGVGKRAAKAVRGSRGGADDGNRVIAGDVLLLDASDNLIWGESRLVALLGVEGLAVIDTGDVTLITRLDRSADVRNLVAELKKRGRTGLT